MIRRVLAFISLAAFTTACSHAVIIDSDPPGAEIKVNGENQGKGPVTYNETTGWEKVYDIEASKPGFKTTRKQVKQTEWNIPVTVASGVGFFVCLAPAIGLLWARQMPDRVVVEMEHGSGSPGDTGSTPPPSNYGY